jgi:periplasmic divalent cation tolerance protein
MVLTTTADEEQARVLARSLGLAACVHIQAIRSVYRWKGEIFDEPEWRLVVKTTVERSPAVEQHIKERHSYETPEIVQVRVDVAGPANI